MALRAASAVNPFQRALAQLAEASAAQHGLPADALTRVLEHLSDQQNRARAVAAGALNAAVAQVALAPEAATRCSRSAFSSHIRCFVPFTHICLSVCLLLQRVGTRFAGAPALARRSARLVLLVLTPPMQRGLCVAARHVPRAHPNVSMESRPGPAARGRFGRARAARRMSSGRGCGGHAGRFDRVGHRQERAPSSAQPGAEVLERSRQAALRWRRWWSASRSTPTQPRYRLRSPGWRTSGERGRASGRKVLEAMHSRAQRRVG